MTKEDKIWELEITGDIVIGELEFRPHSFQAEPTTFIFRVIKIEDGEYCVFIKIHPKNIYSNFSGRPYSLGEMFGIMNVFKEGKIISSTIPEKIMKRAEKEAILMKLE